MENQANTSDEVFFNQNSVKECFNVTPHTNHILLGFMLHKGYKSITDFSFDLGITRSRLSQIIHNHIQANDSLKIKIAKALDVDSRIIFPEVDGGQ